MLYLIKPELNSVQYDYKKVIIFHRSNTIDVFSYIAYIDLHLNLVS